MSNEVEINPDSLASEADLALANLDPMPGVDQVAEPVIPESWSPVVHSLMPIIRMKVVPQWKVGADEQKEFSEALSQCLDQIFPGGISGKYACWFRLFAATGLIVIANMDEDTNKLPPFGPVKKIKDAKPVASAATTTTK